LGRILKLSSFLFSLLSDFSLNTKKTQKRKKDLGTELRLQMDRMNKIWFEI